MPISANGSVHSVTYIVEGFSLTTGYYNPNIFGELMVHQAVEESNPFYHLRKY